MTVVKMVGLLVFHVFTCLLSFFTCFQQLITYNPDLDQETVHIRAMSREAMQCAKQCCSIALQSQALFLEMALRG